MTKKAKIGWIYLIAALFVAVSLFLVVKKSNYLFFALPAVLGILLLYIFSLDKVMMLISFLVPLSVVLEEFEQLAVSLPAEPLLAGVLILFIAKLLNDGKYDRNIAHHPISIVIYCMFIWMLVTTITSEMPVVSIKFIVARLWFVIPSFFLCSSGSISQASASWWSTRPSTTPSTASTAIPPTGSCRLSTMTIRPTERPWPSTSSWPSPTPAYPV